MYKILLLAISIFVHVGLTNQQRVVNVYNLCKPRSFMYMLNDICKYVSPRWKRDKIPRDKPNHTHFITKRYANTFLRTTKHSQKRDLNIMDECCVTKACTLHELTEYCPYIPVFPFNDPEKV